MDKKMFCFQCEQTVGCTGCTGNAGVCGKKADTAKFQGADIFIGIPQLLKIIFLCSAVRNQSFFFSSDFLYHIFNLYIVKIHICNCCKQSFNYEDAEVNRFFCEALFMIGYGESVETLLPTVLKVGEINLKCMALLDKANTETYGTPEPTAVTLTVEKGTSGSGYLHLHSTAAACHIRLIYRKVTDIYCSQEPVFLFLL